MKKTTKKQIIRRKTVLVVEDEQPLIEAIKRKFEINNFDVVSARSVKQAISYLKDIKNIDLIWLDHYLIGKENGLDFLANLKKNKKWRKIPVFVVSNTASPAKTQVYIALGVDKYYVKADYRLDKIIGDIKELLKNE